MERNDGVQVERLSQAQNGSHVGEALGPPDSAGTESRQTVCGFNLLHIGDGLDLMAMEACFAEIPQDPWAPQRHKAISRVRLEGNRIERTEHGPLYQDGGYNRNVYGAQTRDYPELSEVLLQLCYPVIRTYGAFTGIGPHHELLVQAHRVVAAGGEDGQTGSPALEGWHQDGVWQIGMLIVSRRNIYGGETLLATNKNGRRDSIVFSGLLDPGHFILIDDKTVFHNARRIHRMNLSMPAYRDIILVDFPSCRGPNEPRELQ